jgi:V-type H+-transporting ATPase subunit B
MTPAIDQPGLSAQEAAIINAAAVTRDYSVKPRLQYQTVSAVSGSLPLLKT